VEWAWSGLGRNLSMVRVRIMVRASASVRVRVKYLYDIQHAHLVKFAALVFAALACIAYWRGVATSNFGVKNFLISLWFPRDFPVISLKNDVIRCKSGWLT